MSGAIGATGTGWPQDFYTAVTPMPLIPGYPPGFKVLPRAPDGCFYARNEQGRWLVLSRPVAPAWRSLPRRAS